MIDGSHKLPIVRQAQLLQVSRSSVYYLPQPTSEADLAKQALIRYFAFYNQRRPHSALDGQTPDGAYFNRRTLPVAA